MRATFHLKTLAVAIATISVASVTNAAGLDRSGQDITAFLQDGTYAEAVYTYIDADVSGFDNARVATDDAGYVKGKATGDIAESYDFFRYGVKTDINDTFSVGILYDEPFGASAAYSGDNNFTGSPTAAIDGLIAQQLDGKVPGQTITSAAGLDAYVKGVQQQLAAGREQVRQGEAAIAANPALEPVLRPQIDEGKARIAAGEAQVAPLVGLNGYAAGQLANTEGTNVEVRSESITAILGAKFGANKEFQIYGGPVAQRMQADVKLRGSAYGPATGYTSNSNPDMDYGYIVGASYSKPEIALKAALTYRSEIDHSMDITETYPLAGLLAGNPAAATQTNEMEITTPKSVNFDFQTGINPTTLATAKVRWVPWSDFAIVPPLYNQISKRATGDDVGLPLVDYDDDQWQVELGLAKRLAPALAVSGTVGWDSGSGDPTTSLGPIDGYYSVGLGAKYNVTPEWAISAGGKYLWFGDAKGQLPTKQIVGDFQDNDGYILGMKLSYQGK
ncbi:outer membrane protein transport protein [uncultured Psychrobacter sp.]|uniref:outer membrane protein transport protein n=1 Tax=uncultured Psychrobacter sp. TaxID=259303 RepID=UPI002599F72D|nr:outer membrane protein transport protein [uncultured Psychrobacter sp.]